ncbi:hypothetical protein SAMN02745221_00607 [Thermosyntropha lipolytica DSM 11003]|uniref:Lipoprotein n=1 Tax=Thermosyntropha lipolytica DSM 11003 TaxID=1123382 RepID=A0A1M5L9J8_9FIRM|nr:hypothetical protein [Thermosyntropha lipolytica]SHG61697.1 hypothetical protein SAMN02745221_00607 [Thermosyntropha lipolytica DSM 11003]
MRKKGWLLLLVIFLLFSTLACGGSKTEKEKASDKAAVTENKADSPTPVNEPQGTMKMDYDDKKGVALPKGYPSDLLPIYEGSHIFQVIELEGGYTIVACTKDDVKKVMSFYENILTKAQPITETKTGESLTSYGFIGNYTYTIDIAKSNEYEGYNTSIGIILNPQR